MAQSKRKYLPIKMCNFKRIPYKRPLFVLFTLLALCLKSLVLALIAVFFFVKALQEYLTKRTFNAAQGHTAQDAMCPVEDLQMIDHGLTISQASELAIRSSQNIFPIVFNSRVLGIIKKSYLLSYNTDEEDPYISEIMNRDFACCSSKDNLQDILHKVNTGTKAPFIVSEESKFVGMIFENQLLEFLLLKKSQKRSINKKNLDGKTPIKSSK